MSRCRRHQPDRPFALTVVLDRMQCPGRRVRCGLALGGRAAVLKRQGFARAEAPRAPQQHPPDPKPGFAEKETADRAARRAARVELGRYDLGVVEHQQITRAEAIGQVGNAGVANRTSAAMQDEHPSGVAPHRGRLGDKLFRQIEVQVRKRDRGF